MFEQISETVVEAVEQAIMVTFAKFGEKGPVLRSDAELRSPCEGIVGTVSFAGGLAWWLALIFPPETATAVCRKFTSSGIPYESPFMDEAIKELTNVLGGEVVSRLEAKQIDSQMALPTAARGLDVESLLPRTIVPARQLAFGSPRERFWVRMALTPSGQLLGRKPGT